MVWGVLVVHVDGNALKQTSIDAYGVIYIVHGNINMLKLDHVIPNPQLQRRYEITRDFLHTMYQCMSTCVIEVVTPYSCCVEA